MVEMMQWWNALNWPQQVAGDIDRAGISWSELAMDFFRDRKISLPTRHPYDDTRNFQPDIFLLKQSGIDSELVSHIVKNFFLCNGMVEPETRRERIRWPYERQGEKFATSGVDERSQWCCSQTYYSARWLL